MRTVSKGAANQATVLGISAFYHDSAACIVQDGKLIAAAQEERFTRKKHDAGFPQHAIDYCLKEAGVKVSDLTLVAFYDKPLLKFERLLETYLAFWPTGFGMFRRAMPVWLKSKLHVPRELSKGLGGEYKNRFVFLEHHESHAASAFFPSPYEEAAILTMDGVGEWATGSIAVGRGNKLELLEELRFPHSLGLLYSAFTYFLGFRVNSGEYKLMGLAPYGKPLFKDQILQELIDLKADGSFRLNMKYFGYCNRDVMTTPAMDKLFGRPPRKTEDRITEHDMDLAASIQAVTEEVVLRVARHAHELTGVSNLVMAGGVALNCVANGRLLREGPFESIWVQPAAGDAGGALGAALFTWHQLLGHDRHVNGKDQQFGSLLGPDYSVEETRAFLDSTKAVYTYYEDEQEIAQKIAQLIADQNVVGHAAGRMEFGPRALGSRSILGDPRSPEMQSVMNLKIKFRESFRPFAPAVLRERAHEYFEIDEVHDSPYMLMVADVRPEHRVQANGDATGLDAVKQVRSSVPAITHVDYSARLQTVDEERYPRFYRILKAFEAITGCPILINTSFNIRGEPIVNTPQDAYRCFMGTNMDALVIGNFLLLRSEQPDGAKLDNKEYVESFALD